MSGIIIFIKRNALDWQSIKKIDTFEIFNSWHTSYISLYIQLVFYFYVQWTLYHLCFQVLRTTFSCFALRILKKMLQYFSCIFLVLKKKIFLNIFSIDWILFRAQHFIITWSVSWLPNQFRKHRQSKQQPLRGERFEISGKNLIWGT